VIRSAVGYASPSRGNTHPPHSISERTLQNSEPSQLARKLAKDAEALRAYAAAGPEKKEQVSRSIFSPLRVTIMATLPSTANIGRIS
jgi:hypothetical protein